MGPPSAGAWAAASPRSPRPCADAFRPDRGAASRGAAPLRDPARKPGKEAPAAPVIRAEAFPPSYQGHVIPVRPAIPPPGAKRRPSLSIEPRGGFRLLRKMLKSRRIDVFSLLHKRLLCAAKGSFPVLARYLREGLPLSFPRRATGEFSAAHSRTPNSRCICSSKGFR